MAIESYTGQDEYDLVNESQDCRGWTVRDEAGNNLGTVAEMLIDTEMEHVDSVVLDTGTQIPAAELALRDGVVVVRGVAKGEASRRRQTTTTEQKAAMATGAGAKRVQSAGKEVAVPIVEERIKIGKRQISTGGVRVHTRVKETPVEESVTLRKERVNVERHPVNRPVADSDMAALQDGVIEVTETNEEAVVAKQSRVVEEVVVNKEVSEHDKTIRDTVRRNEVEVEKLDRKNAKSQRGKS